MKRTLVSLAAILLTPAVQAADGDLLQRLDNPTPVFEERFGRTLAELQGELLVGTPGDNLQTASPIRFGAYYRYDGGLGLLGQVRNANPEEERFATDLAVSGNQLLVGAFGMHRAYLLDAANGLAGTLIPNPSAVFDNRFGQRVAFAGELLVVAAPRDDIDGFFDAGKVFLMSGPNLQAELQPEVPDNFLFFGSALAARPGLVAVGNPSHSVDGALLTGQVELFDADPLSPSFGQRLAALQPRIDGELASTGRSFGFGVAFDGERLLVSEGSGGDLWVYETAAVRSQGGASLLVRLADLASDAALNSGSPSFGAGLVAANGQALIGAPEQFRADGQGQGVATAVVYDPNHPLFGFRRQLNMPGDGVLADAFGEAVMLRPAAQQWVVGAPGAILQGLPGVGSVLVYNADLSSVSSAPLQLFADPSQSQLQARLFVPGQPEQSIDVDPSGGYSGVVHRDGERVRTLHLQTGQIALEERNGGSFNVDLQGVSANLDQAGSPAEVLAVGQFHQPGNALGFAGSVSAVAAGQPLQQDLAGFVEVTDFDGLLSEPGPGGLRVELPLQIVIPIELPGSNGAITLVGTLVLVEQVVADPLFADGFED